MRDIRVYDFNFNLLTIMSDIISSSWTIKYNEIGTYEGHFRLSDKISDILLKTPYIILTEGENQAICTGKIAENELLICGRTLNWLLKKRVLPPFKTREIFGEEFKDPKTILDYVLEKAFISPPKIDESGQFIENTKDEAKAVQNFTLSPYTHPEKLDRHFWRNSANSTDEIVHDLCEIMGTGHRLFFNTKNKTWDFEILIGDTKSLVLSEKHLNFFDISYTEDIENYASAGWYSESIDSDSGDSVWKYINSNTDTSGILYWESVLSGIGESEALTSLSKKSKNINIQGRVRNLSFREDYNLGDTLKILVTFGNFQKTFIYKVIGVNIWQNETSRGEEPILKFIKEEI